MGFWSSTKTENTSIEWNQLESIPDLEKAIDSSFEKPVLFFKHSTRCGISTAALRRFEKEWSNQQTNCTLYFIDLLAFRDVSNKLSEMSSIIHQSPQVIVLIDNKVVYSASHEKIDATLIADLIK